MNWHRHPELLDRLAADYVVGTMRGGARRRFEATMQLHAEVARAAARWEQRLEPLGHALPALQPPQALWDRIEARSFGRATAPAAAPARAAGRGWLQRWLGPVPAAALSMGLVVGLALPVAWRGLDADPMQAQLPESYVGVLATAGGKPGLIVSSLRRGRIVDLKVIEAAAAPAGHRFVLWTLDAAGQPQRVGPLPALAKGQLRVDIGRSAEDLFARAVELAVSAEADPDAAVPTQPFAYRGLCGKLWPPPAPSQPAAKTP